MAIRKRQPQSEFPPKAPKGSLSTNQVVAANLRLARERSGMTQTALAEKLSDLTGRTYSKATISAMERSADKGQKRLFDVQELLEFARLFELPMGWFLIPTEEQAGRQLDIVGNDHGSDLIWYLWGTESQQRTMRERFRSLVDSSRMQELRGTTDEQIDHYVIARNAALEAILGGAGVELEDQLATAEERMKASGEQLKQSTELIEDLRGQLEYARNKAYMDAHSGEIIEHTRELSDGRILTWREDVVTHIEGDREHSRWVVQGQLDGKPIGRNELLRLIREG